MFFRNDRSPIPVREKTAGIFRVLCIGDSLTYGQGVHLDESLPSRLEYELNRSLWNERVEVINESNCGYSFFDEEALFEFRGKQHDPDLLLIILCSNDTELFGAKGNYSEHIKTNWEPDGSVYPYFKSSFSAFCEKVNEYGVKTLVSYYDLTNSKEEKIYSSMLSDLCKSNDIEFIDLSTSFEGMDPKSLKVSEADAHPSPLAHQIASKELARHILRKKFIDLNEKPLPEISLYSNYRNDAEQMFKKGYTAREIISKTTELLDLKHSSRNRVKLSDELLLNDKDFAVVRTKWEKLQKQNWRLLSLEALAASLEINGSSISSDAKSIENHYRILNKKIIVLMSDLNSGKSGKGPFTYDDTDDESFVSTLMESVAVLDSSGNKIESILAQIENFMSDLENITFDDSPDMDLLNKNLEVRFEMVKSTILNYCTESLMLLKAVMKMVSNVLSIPDYREESIPTQETGRALASIKKDVSNLLKMTLKWSHYINIKNINLNELPEISEKQVRLNINMKCKATKKSMITVNINSIVPHISYYFDQQSVYMDEEFHLYSFKLPIYFLGAFRIWVTGASDISFNDIEIYLDRNKTIKFQKDKISVDESGIINFPLMLMPL